MSRGRAGAPGAGAARAARAAAAAAATAALLLALLAAGCSPVRYGVASLQSTERFRPLPEDARVRCEPGAEEIGRRVAAALPTAIAAVESSQGDRFPRPVCVYVCASMASLKRFTATSVGGGAVLGNRLFLSPRLARAPERVPRILAHELSHLHLSQHVGAVAFAARFPAWFKEGLATYVSGGGGAERVSEEEARRAILEGRHLRAEESDNLLFPQSSQRYGLAAHMFYRQSAMFVRYLDRRDPARFRAFLAALERGEGFTPAFVAAFGVRPAGAWQGFVAALRAEAAPSAPPGR